MRDRHGLVAVVFVASLSVRALVSVLVVPGWESKNGIHPFPDRYPVLAASILDAGTLGYAPEGASPTTTRGPGFPAWLAAGMLVGGSDRWVALWASLPGAAGAALVAWLLVAIAGRRAALVGGFLAGVHPLAVFTSARGMADEFVGVLLLGAAVTASMGWERRRSRAGVARLIGASAALLAIAMLTRATAALGVAALCVSAIALRRPTGRILVLVASSLVLPAGWSVRSSLLEGRPVFVHSLAAYNWWCGEVMDKGGLAERSGEVRGRMMETIAVRGNLPQDPGRFWYGSLTPRETAALESALARAAAERIREDPGEYLARVARGLVWFWTRGETRRRTLEYAILVLPVVVLGAWGGLRVRREGDRRDRDLVVVLSATIVLHMLAYAAVYPSARFAVQVWPALTWLAGWGATRR